MNAVAAEICGGVSATFASNAGLAVAAHLRPHEPRKQVRRMLPLPKFVVGFVLLLLPTQGE